jgi:3-oxosteroid 1-dehydrogenase
VKKDGESVPGFDHEADVVIAGSGAAGLVAALVVAERGLRPLVLEKSDLVGGSSGLSGGGLWIPASPLARAAGAQDSAEDALRYLQALTGDAGPASSPGRLRAFLRAGPQMAGFLQRLGFGFVRTKGYPDYHTDLPGASVTGRCIEAGIFDGRTLGPWLDKLRLQPNAAAMPVYNHELARLALATRTAGGLLTAVNVMGVRGRGRTLLRQVPLTMGGSLIGQLLRLNLDRSTGIWLNSPMVELIKGGLLTDEHARALRADTTPVPGLYAAGNTTASVMGRSYPGPGCTLGAATVFAYLAAQHATRPPQTPQDS